MRLSEARRYIDEVSSELTSDNDRQFLSRVWATGFNYYLSRVSEIDFTNLGKVLDVGSGFGQWSIALSETNNEVIGLDCSEERTRFASGICQAIGNTNVRFIHGDMESLPFSNQSFDGVYSYSSIYLSAYRNSIQEIYRILRPGGRFYLCSNGLGWYLHNILDGRNDANDYSSRDMGISAIKNSLTYYATGNTNEFESIIMASNMVKVELEDIGFKILAIGSEGSIGRKTKDIQSVYPTKMYGHENVWEILCART